MIYATEMFGNCRASSC